MPDHHLRILHLSDLHERVSLDWMNTERKAKVRNGARGRYRVLEANLTKALKEIRDSGRVDLVCFSGDAADWGLPEEYAKVTPRLDVILSTLELSRERLFVIPGNHDIKRDPGVKDALDGLRGLTTSQADATSRWMAGEGVPTGAKPEWREQVLGRLEPYRDWITSLGRTELLPANNAIHPFLGYRVTRTDLGFPFPVHIIGFDSAWLCGDDNDTGKLALTKTQIDLLTGDKNGASLNGFRLAMVHHPLADLSDGLEAQNLLSGEVDVLLRGHQHIPISEDISNPDKSLLVLAAGSLYEGDQGDRWINGFQVIDVTLNDQGRPLEYKVNFWGWSPKGFWHRDNAVYQNAPNGQATIRTKLSVPPAASSQTVTEGRFVGRKPELEQLRQTLLPATGERGSAVVCSVQGMAGVGKSWLVEEFHRQHRDTFPKMNRLVLEANPSQTLSVEDLLGRLADQLETIMANVPTALQESNALVHLENVDNAHLARIASGLAQRLQGVAFVVTGRYSGFSDNAQWKTIPVNLFNETDSFKQLERELNSDAKARTNTSERRELVLALHGLPLALHLAASQLNRGFTVTEFLTRLNQKGGLTTSLPVNDRDYAHRTQRTLEAVFDGSLELLKEELKPSGVSIQGIHRLGFAPRSGFGLNLGAAISGLNDQTKQALVTAVELSVIERIPTLERPDGAWRVHPLLGDHMKGKLDQDSRRETVQALGDWFVKRLPQGESQGERWNELNLELPGLMEWLSGLSKEIVYPVILAGYEFARSHGPYYAWLTATSLGLISISDDNQRSILLWVRGDLARMMGELDLALSYATELQEFEQQQGSEREVAISIGLRADILEIRGQIDEALEIRWNRELPVYQKLGDIREEATTFGKIAGIFQARGQLNEALDILKNHVLPVDQKLGDIGSEAVTQGQIAYIFHVRGQLDEALSTLQNHVLPAFQKLGDLRSEAVTRGRIADNLEARGQLNEALEIRKNQQLPVYQKIGDIREEALTRNGIANILEIQGRLSEALEIRQNHTLLIFQKLGDIRNEAITQSHIADVLEILGDPEEAIRIFRQNVLPIYKQLGDKRTLLDNYAYLAQILIRRAKYTDLPEIESLLNAALQAAREMNIPETTYIEDQMRAIGLEIPD
jgi:tetratricopeptide (TPR) repeat protein/predicted MPP superfamily phosphohydrolase